MNATGIAVLFFASWGVVSFLASVARFLHSMATSDKRRAENERKQKERSNLEESVRRFCAEVKEKDVQIKALNETVLNLGKEVSKWKAACAPLPPRFYGGDLAYDYRDVDIYVPDENFEKLIIGNPLFIALARNNRYDKDAVSLNYDGIEVALLCRGKIHDMALDYLSRGDGGFAIITYVDTETKDAKVHLGFYKGCDFGDNVE